MWQRVLVAAGAVGAAMAGVDFDRFGVREREVVKAGGATKEASAQQLKENPGGKDQLVQVQVVFRHGARTPLEGRYWRGLVERWDVCGSAFKGCPLLIVTEDGRPRPYNEDDISQVFERYPGGCSKGELTLEGQRQAREFGKWLRWRYVMVHDGFLPEAHQPGTVAGRTTNYSRTVATLQGVFSGLYPRSRDPLTAVTTDRIDEILYANVQSCKRLKTLLMDLNKAHRAAGPPLAPDVLSVQSVVRQALGLKEEDRINFVDLHDAITTAQAHGKPLPPALLDPQLQKVVEQQATHRFLSVLAPHAETGKQQEVLRLSMGRLMQLMIQHMDTAAAGAPGPRLHLYSGHDSSIMPLLVALGKDVTHWPPYLSHLVFELWRRPSDGLHYVKVLYNRQPLPLEELKQPLGHPPVTAPTAAAGAAAPAGGAAAAGGEAGAAGAAGTPAAPPPNGIELGLFREHVLGPYLLTQEAHRDECMVHFHHDRPLGDPGSVEEQDIQQEEKVQVGSALSTEEEA